MSFLDHFRQRTYLVYLALPRIVAGWFFFQFGFQKFNSRFLSGQQLSRQLAAAANDPWAWHRGFILNTVAPHAHLFAYIVSFGEMAIGLSLMAGLLVRLSSLFGLFHNLNIYFAIALPNGGPQVGLNRIYIALEIVFIFASAGRALGVDAILEQRFPRSWLF